MIVNSFSNVIQRLIHRQDKTSNSVQGACTWVVWGNSCWKNIFAIKPRVHQESSCS